MSNVELLILGKGEIARKLAQLADAAELPVAVCEPDLDAADWPAGVRLHGRIYTDDPWPLTPSTHAVIARGHAADPLSVATLLQQGAAHVYLIASARRSVSVIEQATALSHVPLDSQRLSAPAGLDLGGRASAEIALSILAEVQWRRHGGNAQPLRAGVAAKLRRPPGIRDDNQCPGKRP